MLDPRGDRLGPRALGLGHQTELGAERCGVGGAVGLPGDRGAVGLVALLVPLVGLAAVDPDRGERQLLDQPALIAVLGREGGFESPDPSIFW